MNKHGGSIKRANKEYGASTLNIQGGRIFDGLGGEITAWMSHGDEAEKIPSGFKVIGSTENSAAAAIVSESESVFGLQFPPRSCPYRAWLKDIGKFCSKHMRGKKRMDHGIVCKNIHRANLISKRRHFMRRQRRH